MNALFLKDLADRTRRGLRGRVELGKSGGGLCYGYQVRRVTSTGESTETGNREIVPVQAEVIRRIFLNRLRMEHRASVSSAKTQLTGVEREIRKLIQAIKDGVAALSIKDELLSLESRKAQLQSRLEAPEMPELLHPRMADVYREKVGSLCHALENEESRTSAVEAIRALIEAIILEPDGDELMITLKGDLAGILSAARDSKRSPETGDLSLQVSMVAGAGFEPATFGL